MDFSCIMPTRGRPELLKNCIHSFYRKAARPDLVEFWLALDVDDTSNCDLDYFICNNRYNVNYIKVGRTTHFHRDYHNRLIRLCQGRYIVGLNDECEVVEDGWDDILREEIEDFLRDKPDRIAYVYPNDTTHVGSNPHTNHGCCFPIFTREAVAAAGCYIPDEIIMWGGDLFTFKIYDSLCERRVLDVQDRVTIFHRSCHNSTREADENTRRIEELSRRQKWDDGVRLKYVEKLDAAIRAARAACPQPPPGKFMTVPLDAVATASTGSPFLQGQPFETVRFPAAGVRHYRGVPFAVLDHAGRNAVVLHGPLGDISRHYPRKVSAPASSPHFVRARKLHVLGCTAGWGYQGAACPGGNNANTLSAQLVVHYASGVMERIDLINGVHIADFHNKRVRVPGTRVVDYSLEDHPIRMLTVDLPVKGEISRVDFVKTDDDTAPIFFALTLEM